MGLEERVLGVREAGGEAESKWERERRLALRRVMWTLPYSAAFLFSSTKLTNTKGFCSCICLRPRSGGLFFLQVVAPKQFKLLLPKWSIKLRTPLILSTEPVVLVDSFRSSAYSRCLCSPRASLWSASSQLERRHLLSGSLSLLHHCTKNTHINKYNICLCIVWKQQLSKCIAAKKVYSSQKFLGILLVWSISDVFLFQNLMKMFLINVSVIEQRTLI